MTQQTTITLQQVKDTLRQTQSVDDDLLTRLLASATQEALRFLGRSELPTLPFEYPYTINSDDEVSEISEEVPSSEDPVAPDVANAIILLVQADYDGDPEKRPMLRSAAESLLMPYRVGLGI